MEWGRWVDLDDCVVQELARRSEEDLRAVLAAGFGGGRADWVVYFLGGSALAFLDYSRLEILILIRLHFF